MVVVYMEKNYTFYEGICFGIDIGNEIAMEVKDKIQERIGYSNLSQELSQLIRFISVHLHQAGRHKRFEQFKYLQDSVEG